MKVYEAVAAACAVESESPVFALMGDANMDLLTAMHDADRSEVVHVRHENSAIAMADGWARASGGVGVASITCGPGMTQIATSLVVAARHGSPMVVLAGDTPRASQYHLQEFDQAPFIAAAESEFVSLKSADTVLDDVRDAFYRARVQRRPVVLSMPMDLQEETYPWDWDYEPSTCLLPDPGPVAPSPRAVQELAEKIASAQKVVFLGGRGAVRAGAGPAICQLADEVGAALVTSVRGKGLFDGHPRDMGIAGAFSSTGAREFFAEADLVVAFGAALGYYTTEGGFLFPGATIVQVDTHPQGVHQGQRAAHEYVRGDAKLVAEQLAGRSAPRQAGEWPVPPLTRPRGEANAPGDGVDPTSALVTLNEHLPDIPVVIGAGHFWNFAVNSFRGRSPENYTFTYDFGCIGQGITVAMGQSHHHGRVAVVEGDGSLLMNVQELETLARHRTPLLCFVMNDGTYGAEVHKLRAKGMSADQLEFGRSAFETIARSVGLEARTVSAVEQIPAVVDQFMAGDAPMVVDVQISPSTIAPTYRRLFYGEAE